MLIELLMASLWASSHPKAQILLALLEHGHTRFLSRKRKRK